MSFTAKSLSYYLIQEAVLLNHKVLRRPEILPLSVPRTLHLDGTEKLS